jgi:hypothetical protein
MLLTAGGGLLIIHWSKTRNKGSSLRIAYANAVGASMRYELCSAILTAVFAAVVVVFGLVFIDQRKQGDIALLLRSMAISQGRVSSVEVAPERHWLVRDSVRALDWRNGNRSSIGD